MTQRAMMALTLFMLLTGCMATSENAAPSGSVPDGEPCDHPLHLLPQPEPPTEPLPVPPGSALEAAFKKGTGALCVDSNTAGAIQAELWRAVGQNATTRPIPFLYEGKAYIVSVPEFRTTAQLLVARAASGVPVDESLLSHPRLGLILRLARAEGNTSMGVTGSQATEALTLLGLLTGNPGRGQYEIEVAGEAYLVTVRW